MASYWTNKCVWITGASSGIGEALVKQLDREGARLILSSRREEVLQALRSNLTGDHEILALDVSNPATLDSTLQENESLISSIDVLINCAGISQRALTWEATHSSERKVMETNFFGSIALAKAVLPVMMKRDSGTIVNLSSVTGKFGFPLRSSYAASKHALQGYFESLQLELKSEGSNVKVVMVCPGRIATPISLSALTADGSKQNEMDPGLASGMPAEVCARKILSATRAGKPEVYIGKEQFLIYLKRFWPSLFRLIASKVNPK